MNRQKVYEKNFSARTLFIAGLVMMPALLFNISAEYRLLQFVFFWLLAWLCGKKISIISTVLVFAGIVFFNLLIPYGRELYSIGTFRITSGALTAGVHRAATFGGLVMLSKFSIRHDLKIPGAFGELLGESLRIFSVLMSRRKNLTGKNLIKKIDGLMMEFSAESFSASDRRQQKTTAIGYILLAVVVVISWLPWLFG